MLSVHAATPSDAPNKIVRVYPKRVIGFSSELDEGVGGEDREQQILHLEAVLGERVDLSLDGRGWDSRRLIDDVLLVECEVPEPRDAALCGARVGGHRLAERGDVGG